MSLILAALLGVLQGITEFLPISSTSHLIFFEQLFSFTPCSGKVFEVVVQLGSGCALFCVYFRKLLNRGAPLILLATIPAGLLGLLFHKAIKTYFYSPIVMATTLILGGLIFLYIERINRQITCTQSSSIDVQQAGIIGTAQALAIIPGVSRSGATISSGLMVGLSRKAAIEFSFLLAIPTLFGAGMYEFFSHFSALSSRDFATLTVGFSCSFFVSLLIIQPLIYTMEKCGLTPFGWYRIIFGLILLGSSL